MGAGESGASGRHWALIAALDELLERQTTVTVGVDGLSAAGKTTLAGLLAAHYGCAVVHMDHFFLPAELRTPERFAQPGGNVHYERFAEEVTPHLGRGEAFSYRPFDCKAMALCSPISVPTSRLTVVEGAYSLHPALGVDYDLRVYLSAPPQVQEDRILRRNGPERVRRFLEEWIPMEIAYERAFSVKHSCDLVY